MWFLPRISFLGGLLFHMLDFIVTLVFKMFMFCYSSFSVILIFQIYETETNFPIILNIFHVEWNPQREQSSDIPRSQLWECFIYEVSAGNILTWNNIVQARPCNGLSLWWDLSPVLLQYNIAPLSSSWLSRFFFEFHLYLFAF